jgi:hypothetical protein
MSLSASQLLKLSSIERDNYERTKLDEVEIDGNIITGYFSYSYFDAKSYFTSPIRSSGGVVSNLNSYATFLTPRLRIGFKSMDIDTYRIIMNLIQSKNEFTVTCYDPVSDKRVTNKMYFQPEEFPELYQYNLKVLRIIGYEIELTGTNSDLSLVSIVYHTNPPSSTGISDSTIGITDIAKGTSYIVGDGAVIDTVSIQDMTFSDTYVFAKWAVSADGSGMKYVNNEEYTINNDLVLYAVWEELSE